MNDLTTFPFGESAIRAITRDGEPLFVANDVAALLGYADPANAIKQHCKGVAFYHPLATAGGTQKVRLLREPDLYRLVISSRLPQAVEFEKHLMEVILPTIRKTGGYQIPKTFVEALELVIEKTRENDRLQSLVKDQTPAVEFVNRYVDASGLFGVRETAKILKIGQNEFIDLCLGRGVLFREHGSLQPSAQWIKAGYLAMKTGEANAHAYKQAKFTARGIEWVRRYLSVDDLLFLREQAAQRESRASSQS